MKPQIILTVPPRIEREFKRRAKAAFRRETFAFLIGTIAGDHAHLDELYWPDDVDEHCTESAVDIQDGWYADAQDYARESEAVILGSAHSHPYANGGGSLKDRAHSETDLDSPVSRMISGICVVQETKSGRLRASMRWWGPSVSLRVERGA